MSIIVLGADQRPIVGKCRVCRAVWREGTPERVMARHMAECARTHVEQTYAERHALDFLKPWDPEWAEYIRSPKGRKEWKPSTKPV